MDPTPHIEYEYNSSNSSLLSSGTSLAQDSKGNIHCLKFSINEIEFTIDNKVIDILDVNNINNLKIKCDKKYMDDYEYGSSFLLSDMAARYKDAERVAFKSIFNYLEKENFKLINDIYYTTKFGNKKFTALQLENILLK